MKKLYGKLALALLPFFILLAVYFINDPFKVLYHYDSYYPANGTQRIYLNSDFVTVQNYLNKYKNQNYDSYIFGSSRGFRFITSDWQKHLSQCSPYQFSSNSESLFGIERKINLIDSLHQPIKNALFIIDAGLYNRCIDEINISHHPILTNKYYALQYNSLYNYANLNFLPSYLYLLFTGKIKKVNDDFCNYPSCYNEITNDLTFPSFDSIINADTSLYYHSRSCEFILRTTIQQYSSQTIKVPQLQLLQHIKALLYKNHTSYKIVISPLYDQIKTNSEDYKILCDIFGKENIYDFSGINGITNDKHNYYEHVHYKVFVANAIMDSIYPK